MTRFHFSCGNSSKGPIGFCADVVAETREEALETLRRSLPSELDGTDYYADDDASGRVEYLRVYLNEDAITLEDIDDEEEIQNGPESNCAKCGTPLDDMDEEDIVEDESESGGVYRYCSEDCCERH